VSLRRKYRKDRCSMDHIGGHEYKQALRSLEAKPQVSLIPWGLKILVRQFRIMSGSQKLSKAHKNNGL